MTILSPNKVCMKEHPQRATSAEEDEDAYGAVITHKTRGMGNLNFKGNDIDTSLKIAYSAAYLLQIGYML